MVDTLSPIYEFTLPEIGASDDTWGTKLNANFTQLSALLASGYQAGSPTNLGYPHVEKSSPRIKFVNTASTAPAGRGQWIYNGDVFRYQRNTHASGDFSTTENIIDIIASDGKTRVVNPAGFAVTVPFELTQYVDEALRVQGVTQALLGFRLDAFPTYNVGQVQFLESNHELRIVNRWGDAVQTQIRIKDDGEIELDNDSFFVIGDVVLGGTALRAFSTNRISMLTGTQFDFQSGLDAGILYAFRDSAGSTSASIYPSGTSAPASHALITREKGDARYAAISSREYKENISTANVYDLASLFNFMEPRRWTWGGKLSTMDNRVGEQGLGFVAEELEHRFPEAIRRLEGGTVTLDPLALIAVLWGKLTVLERSLSNV